MGSCFGTSGLAQRNVKSIPYSYNSYASKMSGVFSLCAIEARSLSMAAKRGSGKGGCFVAILKNSMQSSCRSLPYCTPA